MQVMVAIAMASILTLTTFSIIQINLRSQNQSNLTFQADNLRRSLVTTLNNGKNWQKTISSSGNNFASGAKLDCLLNTVPCTYDEKNDLPTGGVAIGGANGVLINQIFNSTGNLIYDATLPQSGISP